MISQIEGIPPVSYQLGRTCHVCGDSTQTTDDPIFIPCDCDHPSEMIHLSCAIHELTTERGKSIDTVILCPKCKVMRAAEFYSIIYYKKNIWARVFILLMFYFILIYACQFWFYSLYIALFLLPINCIFIVFQLLRLNLSIPWLGPPSMFAMVVNAVFWDKEKQLLYTERLGNKEWLEHPQSFNRLV